MTLCLLNKLLVEASPSLMHLVNITIEYIVFKDLFLLVAYHILVDGGLNLLCYLFYVFCFSPYLCRSAVNKTRHITSIRNQ